MLYDFEKGHVFKGKDVSSLIKLISLLDGKHSLNNIKKKFSKSDLNLLEMLDQYDLIEEAFFQKSKLSIAESSFFNENLSFFSLYSSNPFIIQDKLKSCNVFILFDSHDLIIPMLENISNFGIGSISFALDNFDMDAMTSISKNILLYVKNKNKNSKTKINWIKQKLQKLVHTEYNLNILVQRQIDYDKLLIFNKIMLKQKANWIFFGQKGLKLICSSIFIPGKTACFACLNNRIEDNIMPMAGVMLDDKIIKNIKNPLIPIGLIRLGLDILSVEAMKFLAKKLPFNLLNNMLVFNIVNYNTKFIKVFRHPNCIYCFGEDEY